MSDDLLADIELHEDQEGSMERRLGVDPGLYPGLVPGRNLVQKHRGSKFAIHENALPGRRGRPLT